MGESNTWCVRCQNIFAAGIEQGIKEILLQQPNTKDFLYKVISLFQLPTPTQLPHTIKHKNALGFSQTASSRFHASESHDLQIQSLCKSPADKTPRDYKHWLNIAKGNITEWTGLHS